MSSPTTSSGCSRTARRRPTWSGACGSRRARSSNTIGPNNVIAYNPNGIQLTPDGSSPPSPIQVPTYHNTFTRNSIHDTTGLGIDLAPLGAVTTTAGPLVNDGISIPTITDAQPDGGHGLDVRGLHRRALRRVAAGGSVRRRARPSSARPSPTAPASPSCRCPRRSTASARHRRRRRTRSATRRSSPRTSTCPQAAAPMSRRTAVLDASCVLLTCTMNASAEHRSRRHDPLVHLRLR